MKIKGIYIKWDWSHFKLDGRDIPTIFHRKWVGQNQSSILKNTILEPLGILCIPQHIWLLERTCWLCMTVKVYITRLLGAYIINMKTHAVNEVILLGFLHFWRFLWPWKLTFYWTLTLILQFCFLDDLLKLCFLTRCLSIFTANDEKKEKQNLTLQIFLKDVTEETKLEIHKHSWLLIIWIFKKLNFLE